MTKGPRHKHVPLRTCITCRATSAKRDLIRVVRMPDGTVTLDPKGKLAGRGAYLCRDRACWDQALQGQKLNVALKATLREEELTALRVFAASLPEDTIRDGGSES